MHTFLSVPSATPMQNHKFSTPCFNSGLHGTVGYALRENYSSNVFSMMYRYFQSGDIKKAQVDNSNMRHFFSRNGRIGFLGKETATFDKKVEGVVSQANSLLFQILNRDELFRRCDNVFRNLTGNRIVVVE